MSRDQCGDCAACLERELIRLSLAELALWETAAGDVTKYFNLMGAWADVLVAKGIPQ